MAGKPGIITIREATKDDNEALIALEWLCSQQFNDEITSLDRKPDFFVKPDLQGNAHIWVAEVGEKLIGIHAGAFHHTLVKGERIPTVYLYDMRVHPDFRRHGVAIELMHAAEKASVEMGARLWFLYIRKGNDPSIGLSNKYGMRRLGEVVNMSIETPGLEYLNHPSVRRASRGDALRIVHLINRTHSSFDLYIPHSVEYLNDRLARVKDYSWNDMYVLEKQGRIVACAGLWDKGASERVYVYHALDNKEKTLDAKIVLDWGFEKGEEDSMGNILQHLLGEAARSGKNRLQLWLDPFPEIQKYVNIFPTHRVHWYLNMKPLDGWKGSVRLPAYFDLAYM